MPDQVEQPVVQDTRGKALPQRIAAAIGQRLSLVPVQIGLILVLGAGIYLHTLHAPFLLDDLLCIVDNPAIRSFDYLLNLDRVGNLGLLADIAKSLVLRPVAYWTFALNYRIGGEEVFGYHLVNIAIHLANAALVYLLARDLLKRTQNVRSGAPGTGLPDLLPLLTALLFVAHPLQTQAVTYINQRFTSLLTLFYLATLLLYIAGRTATRPAIRWFAYALALVTTVAAMKTQETAFTLPVMLGLYELLFLDGSLRQRLLALLPFLLTLPVVPITVFRLAAGGGTPVPDASAEQALNLVNYTGINRWDYLFTQFGVIVTYLRMLLLPTGQSLIPAYPLAHSLFEPGIFAACLFLLALLSAALFLAWRARRRGERSVELLIAFGILWFFMTISMSSSFIPLDAVMLEYRVYLPAFGAFFAGLATVTVAVDKAGLPQRAVIGGLSLFILLLSGATIARNSVYNDRIVLLKDILEKNPEATIARVNLAYALNESERFDEAIAELTRLRQLMPDNVNMLVNLGTALTRTGRYDEAARQFREALEIDPANPYAHFNLAGFFRQTGRPDLAERELRIALRNDPLYDFAREELAALLEAQGRSGEAADLYRQLLRTYPGAAFYEEKLRKLTRP